MNRNKRHGISLFAKRNLEEHLFHVKSNLHSTRTFLEAYSNFPSSNVTTIQYDEKNKTSKSAHFRDAIRKHIGYSKINEEKELRGGGEGSLSDYATEVASGFIFSDFYGRLTYNGDPLLIYNDIDKHKEYYNPVNKNIKIVTLEIGSSSTRGYSSSTRQKQKEEYKKFDDLLQWIVKYDKKYD